MTLQSVKTWLTAGVDEAILSFVKGLFHAALVGAALYVAAKMDNWHPNTQDGIIAYMIAYRVWKAFLVYASITGEVKTSSAATSIDTVSSAPVY